MANKFLMVPESVYRGIMTPSTGNLNLDFVAQSLQKAKREKAPPSTKNVHVNQELRRYLNLREEHENKPVKVELAGGPRVLVNKRRGAAAIYDGGDNEPLTTEVALGDEYEAKTPKVEKKKKIHVKKYEPYERRPPVKKGKKEKIEEEVLNAAKDESLLFQTADEELTPLSTRGGHFGPQTSTPLTSKEDLPAGLSEKEAIDHLYNLLQKYSGIVRGDQIYKSRDKLVQGSSVKTSLRFLIQKNKGLIPEIGRKAIMPPGAQYIEGLIEKDPQLKEYLESKTRLPQRQTKEGFKPQTWTS